LADDATASVTESERPLWLESNAMMRMAQVRESGAGAGQILASLPSGFGDPATQWNMSWVRDMAYATVALAHSGTSRRLARNPFSTEAPPGRHELEVAAPTASP